MAYRQPNSITSLTSPLHQDDLASFVGSGGTEATNYQKIHAIDASGGGTMEKHGKMTNVDAATMKKYILGIKQERRTAERQAKGKAEAAKLAEFEEDVEKLNKESGPNMDVRKGMNPGEYGG